MFTKGDKIFAERGCYLKSKQGNAIGFTIVGAAEDYDEIQEDLDVHFESGKLFLYGGKFIIITTGGTYIDIKKKVIKSRYSDDDQFALMLNKDESENGAMLFRKMQEWREFASEVARLVTQG